jgi:RNA polymerase sigma-70 factor, ECF subfamily
VAVRALAGVAPRSRADEGDPDAVLVVAARAEAGRFVALYERYFGPVHRYVRMRVPERAASEDITSDVFLTALSKLGEFRGNGSFAAWLFRIAQNAVRDELRRRHTAEDESALALLVDPRPGPEAQALRNDRLRGLLVVLSREQQDLIALRYGAGLRCSEIAEVLGKTPAAVRVQLHRTLAELRRRYSDED